MDGQTDRQADRQTDRTHRDHEISILRGIVTIASTHASMAQPRIMRKKHWRQRAKCIEMVTKSVVIVKRGVGLKLVSLNVKRG